MKMQNKKKAIFILILALAIVSRVPEFNHENDTDTFRIHKIAEEIKVHKFLYNVYNFFSLFGLIQISYPIGSPTILAFASLLSGLPIEFIVLLIDFLLIIVSASILFSISKYILSNFFYQSVFTISYILSLYFTFQTRWRITARTFEFVIALLIFLFTLLALKDKKYLVLLLGSTMLGAFIHRSTIFVPIIYLIPYMLLSFNAVKYYKAPNIIKYLIVLSILTIFIFRFKNLGYISDYTNFLRTIPFVSLYVGYFLVLSKTTNLFGVLWIIGLIVSILFWNNLDKFQKFLVLAGLISLYFSNDLNYFIILFLPVMLSIVFLAIEKSIGLIHKPEIKRFSKIILILFLLINIFFLSFMIYLNDRTIKRFGLIDWSSETTISASKYLDDLGSEYMLFNDWFLGDRLVAYSKVKTIYFLQDFSNDRIKSNFDLSLFHARERIFNESVYGDRYYDDIFLRNHKAPKLLNLFEFYNISYIVVNEYCPLSSPYRPSEIASNFRTHLKFVINKYEETCFFTDTYPRIISFQNKIYSNSLAGVYNLDFNII